jgi:AcrR family transcriptional regulator
MRTARAVLRERGSEQFLTSEVAERCGVSEGTIYKYFKTKRELLAKVAEEWFEEFLTEEPPPSPDQPIRDRLFHVIWRNLSSIRREPALTRFVLMELRADPQYRQMPVYEQSRRFAKMVMDVVEDGVIRGELRADLPLKLIRDMIFGSIEHQTWAYLRGEGDFSVEESASGITDIVMHGISKISVDPTTPGLSDIVSRLETVTKELRSGIGAIKNISKNP